MPDTGPATTRFVRRRGTDLLDLDGEPRLFRGVGIGNWLLPEGYMWRFFDGATRPRLMEQLVVNLAGERYAATFWTRFRDQFFTRDDVARIAECGFDHIRVPFNWRLFMNADGQFGDEGFRRLDDVIGWCRDAGLLVLLDLHGAPGGQTGANIDDSEHDRPEVFDEPYRSWCLSLWTELATRYRDEPTVMGYDLLNEPCRDEFQHLHANDLVPLYRDLTSAIRAVDSEHLLMYEGSHWSTNFSIFDQVWDENSCLQFHRYWDAPDRDGLAKFIEPAARLGLPLYMGEGGENSVEWMRAAFGSYEQLGISWNFWPWKKLENPSSPADAPAPQGWDEVVAAAERRSQGPAPEVAQRLLDEVLEAFRLSNCRWHGEIVDALLQAPAGFVPAYAAEHRWDAGQGAGVRAADGHTIEYRGGDQGINPFAADPRERARAGEHVLVLRPGETARFRVRGRATSAEAVVAESSPSSPEVQIDDTGITVVGGAGGTELLGVRLS
ncbi:glycoside hydrolase family 5 protein [Aestuariimicrobium ganziense]|uniref:glycoside hydrolase family 5 protein n=1 Tax=Aestuariimicrobium ganziense TaxID=2773677 RepID=UPI00194077A8|nr:cellulase family glycosylhydrolase [Aestuariimicrobium ganziense]